MKITKTASGKKKIKMSKKEWESIDKKANWYDAGMGTERCKECGYYIDKCGPLQDGYCKKCKKYKEDGGLIGKLFNG